MPNVLKKIPRGWELIPAGCKLTAGSKVYSHPFKEWRFIGALSAGRAVNPRGVYIPFGYYIRKKRKARK